MNEARPQPSRALLPLAVFALAAFRAMPGLVAGWRDDVYARGATIAFGVWIVPAIYRVCVPSGRGTGFVWMLLALFTGVAGAGSSLRVLDHLSLVCAITAIARPRDLQLLWVPICLTWLPAAGWFVSRLAEGGLIGWERPLIAVLGIPVFFGWDRERKRTASSP